MGVWHVLKHGWFFVSFILWNDLKGILSSYILGSASEDLSGQSHGVSQGTAQHQTLYPISCVHDVEVISETIRNLIET